MRGYTCCPANARAGRAAPRHRLLGEQLHEQIELLLEERLVLVELEPEQRERFDERAPPEDHLGTAVRDGVEGGEALEDPDRVVGAEHGDRRAEPDPLGAAGDRGQDHFRSRHGEVVAMMLADADEVDPDGIGEDGLLDDVADDLRLGQAPAVRVDGDVAEGVEPEFEMLIHVLPI